MLYNAGPVDVSWAVNSDKVVAIVESFFPAQVSTSYNIDALQLFLHVVSNTGLCCRLVVVLWWMS